jgi:putative tryptophan/tyrosine transport system substrate-binding protein
MRVATSSSTRRLGGAAVAWPLAARAQQPALPVVGFLDLRPPRPDASDVSAFRQGLAAAGFVEGRTVAIEYRWANNEGARLAPLAAELVQRHVAMIVALDSGPTVLMLGADPIKFGLVALRFRRQTSPNSSRKTPRNMAR